MGNEGSKGGGHVLGGSGAGPSHGQRPNGSPSNSNSNSNSNLNFPNRRSSLPPDAPKNKMNPFPTKAPPANSETDREARLAAIEARMGAAEKRGVQKGGGKLAKKLEETKAGQAPAAAGSNNEVADMWRSS
ncbi:hypothetical protein HDU97_001242 [Phlyctochytrium planicorne]|nr:hypothetical protein HDU97_001242 [Phlyctochytrium planicorne]